MDEKNGTNHHKFLESKIEFSYCTLLVKFMYTYMTYIPDIGYAVTTLPKVSATISEYHY